MVWLVKVTNGEQGTVCVEKLSQLFVRMSYHNNIKPSYARSLLDTWKKESAIAYLSTCDIEAMEKVYGQVTD